MTLNAANAKYGWPSPKNLLKAPVNKYTSHLTALKALPSTFQKQYIKSDSPNVLLIVCSGNRDKIDVGRAAAVRAAKVKMANLYDMAFNDAESGVNEQPYNEKGMLGAVNRAMSAVKALESGKLKTATLHRQEVAGLAPVGTLDNFQQGFKRVLVFSIESYFEVSQHKLSRQVHGGADYGALLLFDAFTGKHLMAISEGVRVPWFFIKAALLKGGNLEQGGDVTVGSELASRIEGFDGKSWQHLIAGSGNTRREILLRAAASLPFL
jgi:hypothetical protein